MQKRKWIGLCLSLVILIMNSFLSQADAAALKEGVAGQEVVALQKKLAEFGFYSGVCDGNFGPETKAAVLRIQAENGLVVDGVVGAETWAFIREYHGSAAVNRGVDRKGLQIVATAKSFLGVPYVWAGRSPGGFDCSGFVWYLYQYQGVGLPRMADEQFEVGIPVYNMHDLQQGDLVFFSTYEPGPSHVGIYIGDGQFIHASSGAGEVTITPMNRAYYAARYLGARRVLR